MANVAVFIRSGGIGKPGSLQVILDIIVDTGRAFSTLVDLPFTNTIAQDRTAIVSAVTTELAAQAIAATIADVKKVFGGLL